MDKPWVILLGGAIYFAGLFTLPTTSNAGQLSTLVFALGAGIIGFGIGRLR